MRRKTKKKIKNFILLAIIITGVVIYYTNPKLMTNIANTLDKKEIKAYGIDEVPAYENEDYVYINDNVPNFSEEDLKREIFEEYSELDKLERNGVAFAKISKELMPTEPRKSIGMIKPSGWHLVKYDIVNGKYLYNRCHLIGYQLTGENANRKNLITCTRHMNAETMLEFENKVAEYIKNTNNTVLYRVTPVYKDDNLLASGVQVEALSIEDNGEGIKFNVYLYNVQPGIEIDYKTGDSKLIEE